MSMRRPLLAALALLVPLLLQSPATSAYSILETSDGTPVFWGGDEVVFLLSASGTNQVAFRDVEQAFENATGAWDAIPETSLSVLYGGRSDNGVVGYDRQGNQNVIVFYDREWPFATEALALTLSTWSTPSGELLDSDIAVNSYDFDWAVDGDSACFDLASGLTHEMGHALGLGHTPGIPEATMYASMATGEIIKRDLHLDDVQGFEFLYGAADVIQPEDSGRPDPAPNGTDRPVDEPDACADPGAACPEPTDSGSAGDDPEASDSSTPDEEISDPAPEGGYEPDQTDPGTFPNPKGDTPASPPQPAPDTVPAQDAPFACQNAGQPTPSESLLTLLLFVGALLLGRARLQHRRVPRRVVSSRPRNRHQRACQKTRRPRLMLVALMTSALTVPLDSAPAQATTVTELSLSEMREASSLVVVGEVVRTESYWENGMILTDSLVAVSECVRGDCPTQVTVTSLGGTVGGIAQGVAGSAAYTPGDEIVAFLRSQASGRLTTVGMAQGCFHVRWLDGDLFAVSDRGGLILLDRAGGSSHSPHAVAYRLDDLLTAVRLDTPLLPVTLP